MWRILKEKHNLTAKRYVIYIFCYELVLPSSMGFESLYYLRSTVQMLLAILDSEGVARRKAHRMKRRVYQNKVENLVKLYTV